MFVFLFALVFAPRTEEQTRDDSMVLTVNPFAPAKGPWWTFAVLLGRHLLAIAVVAIIIFPIDALLAAKSMIC